MNPLYLTRIELSEFRTFAHLDIRLAPKPGVLIVHGSNGLGKSSLFNALEWTLTDEIDHFREKKAYKKFGAYLCRHGDRAGPTSAALTFSDENRIERQLATVDSTGSVLNSTVDDITEYLRRPDWDNTISNLNRYLLLTHFLGQSTLSRLTHRNPTDRFQILEEVSRSADLQRFGAMLHGPGNTTPARAFAARIDSLQKSAEELKTILDQENETWGGAQASGAMDDDAAAIVAEAIEVALRAAWPLVSRDSLPNSWTSLRHVDALQNALNQVEDEARNRRYSVTEAQFLIGLRRQRQATLSDYEQATEKAEKDVRAATERLEAARLTFAELQKTVDEKADLLAKTAENHNAHSDLREAWKKLEETRDIETNLLSQLGVAERELAVANATFERRQRLAQIENRLQTEINHIDDALSLTAQSRLAALEWIAHDDAASQAHAELRKRQASHPDLDQDIAAANSRHAAAESNKAEAERMLLLVQSSVEEISVAISAIVEHLPSDMDQCPVCDTKFGEPAELHERAREAAARLAPVLNESQEAHSRASSALTEAAQHLAKLTDERDQQDALRQKIESARLAAESLRARQGWEENWSRGEINALIDTLEADRRHLEAKRGFRARWLSRLAQRNLVSSEANRQREVAERTRAIAVRQAEDVAREVRFAKGEFTSLMTRLMPGETNTTLERIETLIAIASRRKEEAQAEYDTASRELTELELRIGSFERAEERLKEVATELTAQKVDAEAELSDLATRWRYLGWEDSEMTQSTLEAAASDINRANAHIADATTSLQRLRAGREAWGRQAAHKAAFERLSAQVDLAPNSSRDQIRDAVNRKLKTLEEEVAVAKEAKRVASEVSIKISDTVAKFNSDYIKPLDKLTKQINHAILCDERISIDHSVGKRSITQSAGLKGQLSPKAKVDPGLIYSEGQMAALAVSMLCGASLTYPWSRWRGLIFDDPLQHNDAIHASAFADLISNLIEAKDYQVLLSTHDLGQAEFLRRKFDARGMPCAVLNLLGLGNEEVEWEFFPDLEQASDLTDESVGNL